MTETNGNVNEEKRDPVQKQLRQATPPRPSITGTGVALSAVGWLLFALLYSFLVAQDQPRTPFAFLFLGQIVYALLHGLLSVPVWWGTVRAMDDRHWVWPLAAHVVIAPVYAFIGLDVYLFLMHVMVGPFVVEQIQASYQWVLLSGGTIYAVQFVAYHLVRSVQRLRWREQQAAEYAALARERELAALKAQVHPHFLFNTLNSISSTVHADPSKAREMIADLAQLLRHSLDSIDSDTVPLRDEIDVATRYLSLESHRFSDRLGVDVCVEVPEETLSTRVPPMVVQPLVENAVKHGVGPKANGGTIRLRVQRCEGRLRVSIEDDGVGPGDARPLEKGEHGTAATANQENGGVGLVNTDARLRRVLGETSRLHAESITPTGFRVWFDVPTQVEPEERTEAAQAESET
jgi:signal transduction histidine kinase